MASDKALMMEIKAGDIEQLSVLFEKYHVPLLNYFIRMGSPHSISEDLVQETFLRVLKYKNTFQGDHTFSSWIYRIARNTAIDHYRKPMHKNEDQSFEESQHMADDTTLTATIERHQQQDNFHKALAELEPMHREIIVLSRFQQLKYEEIAELLDCNLNTLKTRIRAALASLKNQYEIISGA